MSKACPDLAERLARGAFGAEFHRLRAAAGLTQEQVAAAGKVTRFLISHMEAGRIRPLSEEVLRNMAEVLGVDGDELVISAARCFPPESARSRVGQLLAENRRLRRTAS